MAESIHNWDIDTLIHMKNELVKLRKVLDENKALLTSEGFELLQNMQGRAGQKMFMVTAASVGTLDKLIERYSALEEQLDNIISKCYQPCEQEIIQIVSKLNG